MILIYGLILSLAALADDRDLMDKTFARDNTFCQVGSKRVEITIRGDHSHTDPQERAWGEHVFMKPDDQKSVLLPVNKFSGLYRLFPGNPSSCTKAMGTMIGEKFGILIQKHNRPHKPQLIIQYIHPKTLEILDTVETTYLADSAISMSNGVALRTHLPSRQDIEMGNVMIGGKKYLYQDHDFPIWVMLTKDGFKVDPKLTFEKFSYRQFYKDLSEFGASSGWQDSSNSFSMTKLYVAINHATKSRCIFMTNEKKKLTGEEAWICQ